jgi:hypothetical protein
LQVNEQQQEVAPIEIPIQPGYDAIEQESIVEPVAKKPAVKHAAKKPAAKHTTTKAKGIKK